MHIKSQKDFFAGLMFLAVGVAFAWGATTYNVGSAARMGPGYFPLLLGILLALIGALLTFKALVVETEDGEKIGMWAWKPLFYIIGANVAFGIFLVGLPAIKLPAFGLIVGIYVLVFVASMAMGGSKFKATFILATVLAVGSYLAFVLALKLQFPVWPSFITG
nr:tripartite tricarboxylate transporter TctB family protein [Rhodoferax sp.]